MNATTMPTGKTAETLTRRELKSLMARSNRPGLLHLGAWVLLFSLTTLMVYLSRDQLMLLIPALFVHGVVLVHHFALMHECTHFTAFRSRPLCVALTRVCGFLLMIPPLFFRYEHCDHHSHTNQPGKDPELIDLPESRAAYLFFLSGLPYWYYNIGGMLRRASGHITAAEKRFIPAVERRAVIQEARLMLCGYAAIIAGMVILSSTAPLLYWWIPMLMGEPVMRYIRMTEHVGRPKTADRFENTRTNIVSRPWQFLAWNMNFHAEHHYAASVPFHKLPQLHDRVGPYLHNQTEGYTGAHRDILTRMTQQKRAVKPEHSL